jgi:hypothetical protein
MLLYYGAHFEDRSVEVRSTRDMTRLMNFDPQVRSLYNHKVVATILVHSNSHEALSS